VLQDERQTQNLQASEWHSVHAEVRKRLKRHVAAIEGSEGGSAKVRRLLDCSKAPQKAGTIHHRSKAPPPMPLLDQHISLRTYKIHGKPF
jgi:hypothetical protein